MDFEFSTALSSNSAATPLIPRHGGLNTRYRVCVRRWHRPCFDIPYPLLFSHEPATGFPLPF